MSNETENCVSFIVDGMRVWNFVLIKKIHVIRIKQRRNVFFYEANFYDKNVLPYLYDVDVICG